MPSTPAIDAALDGRAGVRASIHIVLKAVALLTDPARTSAESASTRIFRRMSDLAQDLLAPCGQYQFEEPCAKLAGTAKGAEFAR